MFNVTIWSTKTFDRYLLSIILQLDFFTRNNVTEQVQKSDAGIIIAVTETYDVSAVIVDIELGYFVYHSYICN